MPLRNVGRTDAMVRLSIGAVILVIAGLVNTHPFLTLGAGAFAALVLGTGLTRSCPLYVVFGFTTAHGTAGG